MSLNERLRKYPWLGFTLTVIVVVALVYFHDIVNLSLSFTFVFVVLSVYIGGLWWGLSSAMLVIITEFFLLFPEMQYGRFVLVSLTLLITTWLVWLLQRKAVALDSINGNIDSLLKIMTDLQNTLDDWDRLNRSELKQQVKRATDGIVNLTTRVKGWHDIRAEIEETKRIANGE